MRQRRSWWRSVFVCNLSWGAIAFFAGGQVSAEPPAKSVSGAAPPGESPAQAIARRESELSAELYDGIIRASPDCAKIAAFIRRFHADVKDELARLDRDRQPSDRDYLVAKRETWKQIVDTKSDGYSQAHAACYRDPAFQAARDLVRSLDRRSYCREPTPARSRKGPTASASKPHALPERQLVRVRGNADIQPDTPDALAMAIEDLGTVSVVKACVDERGNVDEATILKTSCFPGYDAKLLAEIRRFQYQPFLVDGKPVRVCTAITFLYRPR